MPEAITIKEAYKTIKDLISREQWLDAHRACLEVLRLDPENIKITHLKLKIEKNVRKNNRKAISEDIKQLQPLWNEKKYEEYLLNLKKLEPYIPDYPQLKNIIIAAEKKYLEQLRDRQEETYRQDIAAITAMMEKHNYQGALLITEKLRVLNIHEAELKTLLAKIRQEWIDGEIQDNSVLLNSKKYENILLLYYRLQRIDPDSIKLKTLIEKTKKEYQWYKIDEKKEFIYKSLEQIRTLMQLKKYDKVNAACSEILEIDPANKLALSFKKSSSGKLSKQINEEVIAQMLNNQNKLKLEYKNDPKDFVRIY